MASGIPFNWSLLDRNNLYALMLKGGKSLIGKRVTVNEFHKNLTKYIKSHLPIKVKMDYSPETKSGWVYIGGTYYADLDLAKRQQIELVFSYNPKDSHIKISYQRWRRMALLMADTLLHEIIHMRQYRARNFKTIPGYQSTAHSGTQRRDQEYYGHPDEIGAYAFNIACDISDRFNGYLPNMRDYIEHGPDKRTKKGSYYEYLKAFNFDHNHKIIKRLKKKIVSYLPYTEFGKPFKTTDYLTY